MSKLSERLRAMPLYTGSQNDPVGTDIGDAAADLLDECEAALQYVKGALLQASRECQTIDFSVDIEKVDALLAKLGGP